MLKFGGIAKKNTWAEESTDIIGMGLNYKKN